MSKQCRVCDLSKRGFPEYYGSCEEITIDFKCLMCKGVNNVIHHANDSVFTGQIFECNICHNYIQYYDDDDMLLYKYEFYYDELLIVNDFESKQTHISFDPLYEAVITLPFIEFSDKDRFFKKIKSLIIFS
jgi:hypothetical protein